MKEELVGAETYQHRLYLTGKCLYETTGRTRKLADHKLGAMETKPHEGRNVKRIREILGVKQETLAIDLGLSQQAISSLEQRETLDVPTLEKIAKTLGVSPEAIRNYNDEAAISIISSSFNDYSSVNYNSTLNFNPVDKIVELYEALLKAEREKFELLKETKSSVSQ